MPNRVPDELNDDLRISIMRLARRIRLERGADDVTDGQLSVLLVLWREGAQTLSSLSERERVSLPSMNRTVNSLVVKELASRTPSADDGRKVLIGATDGGLTLVKETKRKRAAWFATHLETLTAGQRATLVAAAPILRQLADS